MKYLIVGLALFLTACAGSAETRALNGLAAACDTYATVLSNLADHKANLSPDHVKTVDSVNSVVDPICLPGSVVDPVKGIGIVRDGLAILSDIKGSF